MSRKRQLRGRSPKKPKRQLCCRSPKGPKRQLAAADQRGQSGSGACPEPASRRDCHRPQCMSHRMAPARRQSVRNDAGVGAAAVQRSQSGSCAAAVQSPGMLTSGWAALFIVAWRGNALPSRNPRAILCRSADTEQPCTAIRDVESGSDPRLPQARAERRSLSPSGTGLGSTP
jgi:hypothetical protein